MVTLVPLEGFGTNFFIHTHFVVGLVGGLGLTIHFGKICGGGINLYALNFEDFSK